MSFAYPRMAGSPVGRHPAVTGRRMRERALVGLTTGLSLAGALAISVSVQHPSLLLLLALAAGGVGVVALMVSPRYEVTLTVVALYLGLLEGPVKLGSGAHSTASVLRDVLIFAVSAGAVLRLVVKKERLTLPPLSGWVLLFVALVLAEAFNPKTAGFTKALGGFRQQLEWVPFFFFGYALLRSKERFRKFFLLLGVIALANGAVSMYQSRISPQQLASWGPGYHELVEGTQEAGGKGSAARRFVSEGVAHIRPPGLGTDAGFGGGTGALALPGLLALIAAGRLRRRWPIVVLCLGALLAAVTGLGRIQVIGTVLGVVCFAGLSMTAGKRVTRTLTALLAVAVFAVPLGAVLVSVEAKGTFSRYAEIAPGNVTSAKDKKGSSLAHLPKQLAAAPFGVGLATAGAASGFGGKQTNLLEGHGVGSDTQFNFVADELGLPGLVLWVLLTIRVITLGVRRLRSVADVELRIYLAAIFAVIIAFTLIGVSGPTMGSASFGPYFWFATGLAAYWFAGPGRRRAVSSPAL